MYVDLIVVIYLGLGNVFCETIIGLFTWILFEKPIDTFFNFYLFPRINY